MHWHLLQIINSVILSNNSFKHTFWSSIKIEFTNTENQNFTFHEISKSSVNHCILVWWDLGVHIHVYLERYILSQLLKEGSSWDMNFPWSYPLGAVHKLCHFKIDLYGPSNNDSIWCYIPRGALDNDERWTKFTIIDLW